MTSRVLLEYFFREHHVGRHFKEGVLGMSTATLVQSAEQNAASFCDLGHIRCVVTGAANGIGRAIAKKIVELGGAVVLMDCDAEALVATKKSIFKETGSSGVLSYAGDVTVKADRDGLYDYLADKWPSTNALVNNAGICRDSRFVKMPMENWDEVLKVNLDGPAKLSKALLDTWPRDRRGRVSDDESRLFFTEQCRLVFISSVNGLRGVVGQANYSAAKAGLIALSKTLAVELAAMGATVNAVAPGYIESTMTASMKAEVIEAIRREIPARRLGTPEDVANSVAFLLSKEGSYLNGSVLTVDGGLHT